MENNIIEKVFTQNNDEVDATLNNLNINCLTSRNNKFSLDSDGNLIVNSITAQNSSSSSLTFNDIYPVGSIYMSINNTNPSNYFGGSWQEFAKGRTLVGVNPSESEFNRVEKTGGSKYMQSHRHIGLSWLGDDTNQSISLNSGGAQGYNLSYTNSLINDLKTNIQTRSSGAGNSENLQPYITCYIWKRIS